ncbi:MAG: amidohydrolase family protein, partial [Candidatus Glassbacteria bacterium]|nr:amidohydrolase family protein [Candidatus Glassbacteria bacterium]
MKHLFKTFVLLAFLPVLVAGQEPAGELKLLDWKPVSQLVVKETRVLRPKFPVIDIHNHLGRLENTRKYLEEMDLAGVWKCVSLDARSRDDQYKEHLRVSQSVSKDRFLVFFRPDFSRIDEPDFGVKEARKLEEAVKLGIKGLKINKSLGLTLKDKSGKLVPVDDPRIDPIWAKCGELGIPVMIHVSDPKAFFTPVDKYNERYDELGAHPDWSFAGEEFPSKMEILAQRNRVFAKHPNTVFIGAHMATLPEELHQVGMWLDCYPNLYVDIDARISDLGRQPCTARKFLIKYQDRVMFGTDTPCSAEAYRIYYRFLETDDEYFDPAGGHHLQGRWMIYG